MPELPWQFAFIHKMLLVAMQQRLTDFRADA
jgi:hypothetical protein